MKNMIRETRLHCSNFEILEFRMYQKTLNKSHRVLKQRPNVQRTKLLVT